MHVSTFIVFIIGNLLCFLPHKSWQIRHFCNCMTICTARGFEQRINYDNRPAGTQDLVVQREFLLNKKKIKSHRCDDQIPILKMCFTWSFYLICCLRRGLLEYIIIYISLNVSPRPFIQGIRVDLRVSRKFLILHYNISEI